METGSAEVENQAAASGEADGAQPRGVAGAGAIVRVTVIPAHSPVQETTETGGGSRILVCDFGPEDPSGFECNARVWSFESLKEAAIHTAKLREEGRRARILNPGLSKKKGRKTSLNDRLAASAND